MAQPPKRDSGRDAGRSRKPSQSASRGSTRDSTRGSARSSSRPPSTTRPAGEPIRTPAPRDPELPGDISWQDLDGKARQELRSLPKELAERVGAQLAAAGITVDDDPEAALAHARCARRLASRVAITREALALTAYAAGKFDLALGEFRTYRRMSGDEQHLPLMVDCERALGRPERALDLAASPSAKELDALGQRELRIVVAGARRDLGQPEAAVLLLESDRGLESAATDSSLVRLRYAYADALRELGRDQEARAWFARVTAEDTEQLTDAAEVLPTLGDGLERIGRRAFAVPLLAGVLVDQLGISIEHVLRLVARRYASGRGPHHPPQRHVFRLVGGVLEAVGASDQGPDHRTDD